MITPSSLLLPPLGLLYGAITKTRLSLYQRGMFKSVNLPCPVVSIGNITTGGTGKTPIVEWVSRVLAEGGKKVCILTRGYRRANPKDRLLVSDGTTVFSSAAEAGDEAFLLATNLVGLAAVVADANRVRGGEGAIKHLDVNCFVLDDGFQHLRISRDFNIVLIDATDPWGGGQLLPNGRLREPVSGLARADCVLVTRVDQVEETSPLEKRIEELSPHAPVFRSRMTTRSIRNLNGSESFVGDRSVAAFCGIGNPQSFFTHLRREGFDLHHQRAFPDHYAYNQVDIDELEETAKRVGVKSLITTAKDSVKLSSLKFAVPCYVLEIEPEIENGEELRSLILAVSNKIKATAEE